MLECINGNVRANHASYLNMHSRLAAVTLVGIALLLAVFLALMSVEIERIGPEQIQYGNLCGPLANGPCYQPALKGGFPFPYLVDAPGISTERQLAFLEDTFRPGALALDVVVYFMVILAVAVPVTRRWALHRGAAD